MLFTDCEVYLKDVEIYKYADFYEKAEGLLGKKVIISEDCNAYLANLFEVENVSDNLFTSKIKQMQAKKNETELVGMILSYFYDGIALINTFGQIQEMSEEFTEMDCAEILLKNKNDLPGFVQPSFETISCTGSNGAIIHHRPTDTIVDKKAPYLIDSGSQYLFGTTDTTRTCLFDNDKTKDDLIKDYTLVLKGHLKVMMHKYKLDDTWAKIDEVSREFLKNDGKDFCHSVSHGVGHFLNVHEHPPIVSSESKEMIEGDFVFSNEPGYYKEDHYGIRIENLVFSRKCEEYVQIVNFTMVPYDLDLIDLKMLSIEEKEYLNELNMKIHNLFEDELTSAGLKYLKQHTKKI